MYTVDASMWVNTFDQREPGHLVSRQFLDVLPSQALPVIVPNLVLVEVAGRSVGRAVLQPAQDAVNEGNRIAREKSRAREGDP